MRYSQISSFISHLVEAAPDHICPYYLILLKEEWERKSLLKKVGSYMEKEVPSILTNLKAEEISYLLLSPTFFSKKEPLVMVDFTQTFPKTEQEKLLLFLQKNPHSRLVMGASSKEEVRYLYGWFEQRGVILEVSTKNAALYLQEWIKRKLQLEKKQFTPEALAYFLSHSKKELSFIEQELEKLFCYVGDKSLIEKEEVQKIISTSEKAVWHLASCLIWDLHVEKELVFAEDSLFFPLVTFLRKELKTGWKMALLLEQGVFHLSPYFPGFWSKLLEEKKAKAKDLTSAYFKKGLIYLFEIEFLAKDGLVDYGTLLMSFLGKLHELAPTS